MKNEVQKVTYDNAINKYFEKYIEVEVINLKKKLFYFVGLMLLMLLLQACVSKEEAGDELMQYFNNDMNSKEYEHYLVVSKRSFNGSENLNEDMERHFKERMIPAIEDLINYLESLDYKSRQVNKLNEIDIKNYKNTIKFFRDIAESLSEGSTIDEVNSKFNKREGKIVRKLDKYVKYRKKLIEKFELESYTDYDSDGKREVKLERKPKVEREKKWDFQLDW